MGLLNKTLEKIKSLNEEAMKESKEKIEYKH